VAAEAEAADMTVAVADSSQVVREDLICAVGRMSEVLPVVAVAEEAAGHIHCCLRI
jgi:hypothetical protein